jgi:transposase-like protein
VLTGKYQRRLPGFDGKVISLYTRGMSTPQTLLQTCIVHLLRNALAHLAGPPPTADAAQRALDAFEAGPWARNTP